MGLRKTTGEEKLAIAFITFWGFWLLLVLMANVAIIWVIVHFISKYW